MGYREIPAGLPGDAPLTGSQVELCRLNQDMMAGQGFGLSTQEFGIERLVIPWEVRSRLLESPTSDLMLPSGQVLLPDADKYPAEHNGFPRVTATPHKLAGMSISTWGTSHRRRRFITPDKRSDFPQPDERYVVDHGDMLAIDWPGIYEWEGRADIRFWYKDGPFGAPVGEAIGITTSHNRRGELPELQADVAINQYSDGYIRYERVKRAAKDEAEATALIGLIRSLFAHRV